MLNLQHIYKSFNGNQVIADFNLALNAGDITAVIGENGAGKTTIMKLILGEITPDSGSVSLQNETIGYIPQDFYASTNVRGVFAAAIEDWRVDNALAAVGLGNMPKNTPLPELSGGQKTRLAFATVLAQDPKPSLLLLDEPTNNLDAAGLEWLEDFIRTFDGAVLLVSHDRQFVNSTANVIVELHNGTLTKYGGNYDFYREQKELEQAAKRARYQQNVEERNHLTKAITAQRVKGKNTHEHIKRSDGDNYQRDFFRNSVTNKFGQQARALEKRLKQLENVERPEFAKDYKIALGGELDSSKLVLRLKDVVKGFPEPVLDGINLVIRGSERVHVKGQNGSGKTTLLTIAAGRVLPDSGEVTFGNSIRVGYFSQVVDGLDYATTGLENLVKTEAKLSSIFREACNLGLTDTDLKKPVSVLSRGQQAKLGLTKLLLGSHHLLILDEPTNHLDIPTKEMIESALQRYRGAVLFATHDRYFANKLKPTKELKL